jgi:sporulation protein YlmC with PRC-barrel domain
MDALSLVRDVLDAQLVDRREEKIGRVDDVLLELRDGEPPMVKMILIGGAVRAERIGRWMSALREAIRVATRQGDDRVSRIPFATVRRIGDTIRLDVDGETLPSGQLERWLVEHVVCRIPGGSGERK